MILEFAYGAVAQVARFVGRFPAAFGWSAGGTATPTGGLVCAAAGIRPRVLGDAGLRTRVLGSAGCRTRVLGTAGLREC